MSRPYKVLMQDAATLPEVAVARSRVLGDKTDVQVDYVRCLFDIDEMRTLDYGLILTDAHGGSDCCMIVLAQAHAAQIPIVMLTSESLLPNQAILDRLGAMTRSSTVDLALDVIDLTCRDVMDTLERAVRENKPASTQPRR